MNGIKNLHRVLIGLLTIFALSTSWAAAPHMDPQHAAVADSWLANHDSFRLATIDDCDCMESIRLLRAGGGAWKPQPAYHPYYALGDFDGNGYRDFAVVVRSHAARADSKVLVFLRDHAGNFSEPLIFPIISKTIQDFGLFIGRAAGRTDRLLWGVFESEGEQLRIPKAKK